jgi:hypothetical protein
VKIWDGNSWLEGIYRVDGAELIHQSEFTLLKKDLKTAIKHHSL